MRPEFQRREFLRKQTHRSANENGMKAALTFGSGE
jgi:hypothetical protein